MPQPKPIDLDKLDAIFTEMDRDGCAYRLGAKAKRLDMDPGLIAAIDCSGFSRLAIYQASGGWDIGEGSQNQLAYFEKLAAQGIVHKLSKYADVQYAAQDEGRLFICFIKVNTNGCGKVGHVWLVQAGDTMESRGGVGVDSRPWNTRVLKKQAFAAFELPVK